MNRFFDNVNDGNQNQIETTVQYQQRLKLAAEKFFDAYDAPDVIAAQEVENMRVLQDLAGQINLNKGVSYQAILQKGNDISGINVGYLVRNVLTITEQKQLFKNDRLDDSQQRPLFARPPLLIEVCQTNCVTLVNLHLRSMQGLRSGRQGKRVAKKRQQQSNRLAHWVHQFQRRQPQKSLIILGDFNALQPPDHYSDIVGTIVGNPDNSAVRYPTRDWIKRDLIDLTKQIPKPQRYSYVYQGQRQILDYMLANQNFAHQLKNIRFGRIDKSFSDHAGLLAEFNW